MNFNEEMAKELNGKVIEISEEDKGTPMDYINLEKSIFNPINVLPRSDS